MGPFTRFRSHSRNQGIALVAWLSVAFALIMPASVSANGEFDNGAECGNNGDCRSGYCSPHPNKRRYCLARHMDCAEPESDGLPFGYTTTVDGRTWICQAGTNWRSSDKLANGSVCNGDSLCSSGRCSPNPDGRRYCLAKPLGCADSRTNGVDFGYTMQILGKSWTCIRGKGWGPARFSDFRDGVGKYRNCSQPACDAEAAGCVARLRSRKRECEQLKAIEIELGKPVSVAIVQARDSAERAGVHKIPGHIRAKLEPFFTTHTLDRVRYRVGVTDESEILRFAFQWLHTSAMVMDRVIIFRDEQDALNNVRVWAHELEHVIQYEALGVDGFAQRWMLPATRGNYDEDRSTIEGAATARSIYVCSHISC